MTGEEVDLTSKHVFVHRSTEYLFCYDLDGFIKLDLLSN